ncbi:MAG: DUF2330 domain-containing protein, partial [Myxococcota bacterium]
MPRHMPVVLSVMVALVTLGSVPTEAGAFCGFYVSGANTKLYNNATAVVLMREGTKTVLSMQNNYQGPPKDFAMVVPVPVILQQDHVKTLQPGLFDKIDQLASPRLVEYWEQNPCPQRSRGKRVALKTTGVGMGSGGGGLGKGSAVSTVKVEAQFAVGEYEIVILSATEAQGLERWLRENRYNIPDGASAVLRPYIEGGMYFFVAKVDAKKVAFNAKGQTMLSPLRFHYDSKQFKLPVRLGLLNAKGTQDLLIHVLARNTRYEVKNAPNVTIPTNLIVADATRKRFGEFYAALLDRTLKQYPGAVIT